MGVKGLENMLQTNTEMRHISKLISIPNEIAQWQRTRRTKPTIIIPLKCFVNIVAKIDQNTLIMGGEYEMYNEMFKRFFQQLIDCGAELVFFCRPYLHRNKEDLIQRAYDEIDEGRLQHFKQYLANVYSDHFPWHLSPIVQYNLMGICRDYGTVYTEIGHIGSKIVKYANNRSNNVLAIIEYDTDMLFYDDIQYQYWNLVTLNIFDLTVKKYCYKTLREQFGMTAQKGQWLSAISRSGTRIVTGLKRQIQYVRSQRNFQLQQVACDIFGRNYTEDQIEKVKAGLSRFDLDSNDAFLDDHPISNELFRFCKERIYFAYGLIIADQTIHQALLYVDLRQPNSTEYVEVIVSVLLKMLGILFKDVAIEERPKTRLMKIKRTHDEIDSKFEGEINYNFPPLPANATTENLIVREDDESLDNLRWKLFQWVTDLNVETIETIKESVDTNYVQIVLFTLKFLLTHNLITSAEADAIWLVEMYGESKPGTLNIDNICIERSCIQTAHKYTIAFELICHCLEICGLGKQIVLIQLNVSHLPKMSEDNEKNRELWERCQHSKLLRTLQ